MWPSPTLLCKGGSPTGCTGAGWLRLLCPCSRAQAGSVGARGRWTLHLRDGNSAVPQCSPKGDWASWDSPCASLQVQSPITCSPRAGRADGSHPNAPLQGRAGSPQGAESTLPSSRGHPAVPKPSRFPQGEAFMRTAVTSRLALHHSLIPPLGQQAGDALGPNTQGSVGIKVLRIGSLWGGGCLPLRVCAVPGEFQALHGHQ